MALSRQPEQEAPSVLMASACVDFRGDMQAAATAGDNRNLLLSSIASYSISAMSCVFLGIIVN